MKNDKERILRIVAYALMALLIILKAATVLYDDKKPASSDAEKFASEYKNVNKVNMFRYRSLKEANSLIKNNSGFFFFCNSKDEMCQYYAQYLFEEADDFSLDEISYIDIKNDYDKDTDDFKELLDLIKNYVSEIKYPLSVVVNKGNIIAVDNTSVGFDKEYWSKENIEKFKIEMMRHMSHINSNSCDDDCN
jgi:hypothetical protein